MNLTEKSLKILLAVFVMVFSFTVLVQKIPETKYVQKTVERLEESQNTIMKFSGSTMGTSVAISALPDDFGSPLAGTIADLNMYFIFMFAVIFVEKLLVIEGMKIAFAYIVPAACLLYMAFVLSSKNVFKNFANKLLILGMAIIIVIPFSTYFTETVCNDYLAYVEETIEEADAGAAKINEVMAESDEDATFFDRISAAFKTSIQSVSDLLAYFKNVVRKCVNSVAIMLVTTFVVPLLILMLFRWLLKELFALHIPFPAIPVKLMNKKEQDSSETAELVLEEDELCRK